MTQIPAELPGVEGDPRLKAIYARVVEKMKEVVREFGITQDELHTAGDFFNRLGQSGFCRSLIDVNLAMTSVDVTAADVICELDDTLHTAGIELCFAEMKDPVKDKLKRFGLFTRLGEQTFFATLGEAVSTYLKVHRIEWVDWKDRTQ